MVKVIEVTVPAGAGGEGLALAELAAALQVLQAAFAARLGQLAGAMRAALPGVPW